MRQSRAHAPPQQWPPPPPPPLPEVAPRSLTHQVLATFGVWLSVARGLLGDAALDLLARAAPEYLWLPLRNVLEGFTAAASGDAISAEEHALTHLILSVHCWPAAGDVLRRQLQRDPYYLRRVINAERWAPGPDGQQCILAGLWLWTCVAGDRPPPTLLELPPLVSFFMRPRLRWLGPLLIFSAAPFSTQRPPGGIPGTTPHGRQTPA